MRKRQGVPGHQSGYKPEYCDLLVRLMGEGYSKAEFCSRVGIAESTFDNWVKVHGEFQEAWGVFSSCCDMRYIAGILAVFTCSVSVVIIVGILCVI